MAKLIDIANAINERIPFDLKEDFDNVGLLVGDENAEITRVLFALDITDSIINEAKEMGCELIVSHHPVIRKDTQINAVKNDFSPEGRVFRLIKNGIAAICLHTNLDSVQGGVNDILATACGLSDVHPIICKNGEPKIGLGRIGELEKPLSLQMFARDVKENLHGTYVLIHDAGLPVKKVAVMGGSLPTMIYEAKAAGCDTFVTGEMKHNFHVEAADLKINLVIAGHHFTEDPSLVLPMSVIKEKFPGIELIKSTLLDNVITTI
ncbi:MAG: Nif3-like dinuclear metal center hexameric protein [Bacillota bacterium]|nr:Nif3-like dinuclear metal center hexameric protein [Bacillota bacterium]